jgi:hypothetical protein
VIGTGLDLEHLVGSLPHQRLPVKLLAALRVLVMDEEELAMPVDPTVDSVSCSNEQRVADTLACLVGGLLEGLPEPAADDDDGAEVSREVRLARRYCASQRRLLQGVLVAAASLYTRTGLTATLD